MSCNYSIINNTPITVNKGETWGEQDVPSSWSDNTPTDGLADLGNIPVRMTIVPDNGYAVHASLFTISGAEPDIDTVWPPGMTAFSTSNNSSVNIGDALDTDSEVAGRFWGPSSLAGNVPEWCNGVFMLNTNTNIDSIPTEAQLMQPSAALNKVEVFVFISSIYNIPELDNINLVLDIDGCALAIPSSTDDNNINTTSNQTQFTVTLTLAKGLDANCEIVPFVPSWAYATTTPNNYWQITPGAESDTSATLTFTPGSSMPPNTKVIDQPLDVLPPGADDNGFMMFAIKPKEGYALSRHNLWFQTGFNAWGSDINVDQWIGLYGPTWMNGSDPDLLPQEESDFLYSSDFGAVSFSTWYLNPVAEWGNVGLNVPNGEPGYVQPGYMRNTTDYTGVLIESYTGSMTTLQGTPDDWWLDQTFYESLSLPHLLDVFCNEPPTTQDFSPCRDVLQSNWEVGVRLMDSIANMGAYDSPWPSDFSETWLPCGDVPGQTVASYDIGGQGCFFDLDQDVQWNCASDWEDNVVYFIINKFAEWVPPENVDNIEFKVYGEAMIADSNCVDYTIEIEG